MQLKLLSLDPPDSKHPANTLAVATVEFIFGAGETLIVNDYRVVKNSRPGPDWVAPPTRWGDASKPTPIVTTSRRTLHQIEDLILDAYEKQQVAQLKADDDASSPLTDGAR